jgi:hypothetical protein
MAKATIVQSTTTDTLVNIVEVALDARYKDRAANLVDIGKLTLIASRMLRFKDRDERTDCENAAVIALAKKRQLVS